MSCIKCQKHDQIKKKHKETVNIRYRLKLVKQPNPVYMIARKSEEARVKKRQSCKSQYSFNIDFTDASWDKKQDKNLVQFSTVYTVNRFREMLVSPDRTYVRLQLRYT